MASGRRSLWHLSVTVGAGARCRMRRASGSGRRSYPPGLDHELGHLIEVNPAEPDEDRGIPVIVRRDEELLRFGHEQFVALIEAGATHEHRVWKFVHADEQIAAHPERGKPVVGFLDDRGQRQRNPANVVLGHHPPMLWQLLHGASAPASNQSAARSHAAYRVRAVRSQLSGQTRRTRKRQPSCRKPGSSYVNRTCWPARSSR